MHKALVSIGLPTYNRPKGLQRTINSLINQTYSNLEIIISDNCSEIVDVHRVASDAQALDNRIKYFRQDKNRGPIYNFKFVLKEAKGRYFMWAADDDLWDPKFIEKLVFNLEKFPEAVSGFCNIKEIDQQDRITNQFQYSNYLSDSNLFNRLEYFLKLKEGSFGKASLIYGLHKLETIKEIFLNSVYNYYCSDNVIILKLLCSGQIIIENKFLYSVGSYNEKLYDPSFEKIEVVSKQKGYTAVIVDFLIKRRKYFSESNAVIRHNVNGIPGALNLILINLRKELEFISKDIFDLSSFVKNKLRGGLSKYFRRFFKITKKTSI